MVLFLYLYIETDFCQGEKYARSFLPKIGGFMRSTGGIGCLKEGKEKKKVVCCNAVRVKPSSYSHKLYRVVVKCFGMEPMMLLATCEIETYQEESNYLVRWKCDESYRYTNRKAPVELRLDKCKQKG